jgi:FtsP/CotA-like multicopper oxidase with cupredoxin domain
MVGPTTLPKLVSVQLPDNRNYMLTVAIGQYKDYYYPNRQNARTLWYHDHAVDHTAENVFFGQAGFYILHDEEELNKGLPTGDYDIPLGIMARRYNADGSLWDPEKNNELTSGMCNSIPRLLHTSPNFLIHRSIW